MNFLKTALIATGLAFCGAIGAAQAGTYSFTVTTGATGGSGFLTLPTSAPFTGAVVSASFTYAGPIMFDSLAAQNATNAGDKNSDFFGSYAAGISGYSGAGALGLPSSADFTTLASFLASSGSASNYSYGSFYAIDLGVLAKGTVLSIFHDDGVSVYQGSTRINPSVAGPTSRVTVVVTLSNTADTILYYSRQNGTPSVLEVTVPEPVSLSLFGISLLGLGLARRRMARVA